MVHDRLRAGGKFIGIDWFSSEHQDAKRGDEVDPHTRTNFTSGPFAGVGNVHFCDQEHLKNLMGGAGLSLVHLEHKQTQGRVPAGGNRFGYWNFVAVKL